MTIPSRDEDNLCICLLCQKAAAQTISCTKKLSLKHKNPHITKGDTFSISQMPVAATVAGTRNTIKGYSTKAGNNNNNILQQQHKIVEQRQDMQQQEQRMTIQLKNQSVDFRPNRFINT